MHVPRLAAIIAVLLAVAACGGGGESPTTAPSRAGATPSPAASPTSTPTSTPNEPDMDSYLEFLGAVCRGAEEVNLTWGAVIPYLEDAIEQVKGRKPPEELRDYIEAWVAVYQATLAHAEEQHPDTRTDSDAAAQAFAEDPEVRAATNVFLEVQSALDPDLARAIQAAGC